MAAQMRHTADVGDVLAIPDKRSIQLIAVRLQDARPVFMEERIGAVPTAREIEVEQDHLLIWCVTGPQVGLRRLAAPIRIQYLDGGFIHLHIAAGEDAVFELRMDRAQQMRALLHPAALLLARQVHTGARGDLLQPVQGQLIHELSDQNVGQESGACPGLRDHAGRQLRHLRCNLLGRIGIHGSHDPMQVITAGLVFVFFGDFLADFLKRDLLFFRQIDQRGLDAQMPRRRMPATTFFGLVSLRLHGERRDGRRGLDGQFLIRLDLAQQQRQLVRIDLLAFRSEQLSQQLLQRCGYRIRACAPSESSTLTARARIFLPADTSRAGFSVQSRPAAAAVAPRSSSPPHPACLANHRWRALGVSRTPRTRASRC